MKPYKGKWGEGCWYCLMVDDNLTLSREWDCPVHIQCIKNRLEQDPKDEEALIFAREFDLKELIS